MKESNNTCGTINLNECRRTKIGSNAAQCSAMGIEDGIVVWWRKNTCGNNRGYREKTEEDTTDR